MALFGGFCKGETILQVGLLGRRNDFTSQRQKKLFVEEPEGWEERRENEDDEDEDEE